MYVFNDIFYQQLFLSISFQPFMVLYIMYLKGSEFVFFQVLFYSLL